MRLTSNQDAYHDNVGAAVCIQLVFLFVFLKEGCILLSCAVRIVGKFSRQKRDDHAGSHPKGGFNTHLVSLHAAHQTYQGVTPSARAAESDDRSRSSRSERVKQNTESRPRRRSSSFKAAVLIP